MTSNHEETDFPDPDRATVLPTESGFIGKAVNKLGMVFSGCFVLSATVLVFEIFMRYVLNAPTLWAHETTTLLCASGFVFAGLYCASHNKHIRVVIIYDAVSERVRRYLDIFVYLTCSIATATFSYAAWVSAERALFAPSGDIRLQTSGSAWNPPSPAILKTFLLVVLIVISLQYLWLAISHIRGKSSNV